MNAAICLLAYGVAVTWLCPPLLVRLTRSGLSPRFSIALWLGAIAVAIGVWLVVGAGLVLDVLTGGPGSGSVEHCMRLVARLAAAGWAGHLAIGVVGALAVGVSAVVTRRIVLALNRFWSVSRDHAHDARLVGRSTEGPRVVVVPAERPAAYCVAGRPDAIVLTTGAIDALGEAELAAVLAHEEAHLAGRHPQLMIVLRALATAMPRLPLFRNAVDSVGRLVEMSADDRAVGRHGRQAVLGGLVGLAGQPRAVGGALGAADTAALARVTRLVAPTRRGARLRRQALLAATLAGLALTPVAVSALCHL